LRRDLLILLTVFAVCVPAWAAPHLVKDLNLGPDTDPPILQVSKYDDTAFLDGLLLFSASDPAHGLELWRSDGSTAGTYRVTDVCPGRCDTFTAPMAFFRGQIYFTADDGFSGKELWRSAGTPGSERRVRDICPGPCSSDPIVLDVLGDALLFIAGDGQKRQLWRTDGSRRGTVPIATLSPPATHLSSSSLRPAPRRDGARRSQRVGDRLIFMVESTYRIDLWTTDGTPAGTVSLSALVPGAQPSV
jgi:ELWxxDGT repeat protein